MGHQARNLKLIKGGKKEPRILKNITITLLISIALFIITVILWR